MHPPTPSDMDAMLFARVAIFCFACGLFEYWMKDLVAFLLRVKFKRRVLLTFRKIKKRLKSP